MSSSFKTKVHRRSSSIKLEIPDDFVEEQPIPKSQHQAQNHPIITINQERKLTNLFKNFRSSVQQNQTLGLPKEKEKNIKKISFRQDGDSPLLNIKKKQETTFEPMDVEEHKENFKLQLSSKRNFQSSENMKSSKSRFQNQFKEEYPQNDKQHEFPLIDHKNIESFNFGQGLESIDNQSSEKFQSTSPQRSTGIFGIDKTTKSFEQAESTFTPNPSNVSVSKKLQYRPSNELLRTTSRNFFKRPSSLAASGQFLKNMSTQGEKFERKEKGKMNLSIVPFRESQTRGMTMTQFKRESSQVKSVNNSYKLMSQALIDSKNRAKKQGPHLSFANSLNRLLFKYNGGHATTLYNYRLKIKNESPVRLSIKIKCTTPRSYEVRPSTESILNSQQILNVSIELKLFTHDLNHTTMKHDLSRYEGDKFKVIYWTTDQATQEEYFEGEKVLPVVIEQTEEEKARNMGMEQNLTDEKQKQASEEKQVEMYRKLIERNKKGVEQVDGKIEVLNSHEFRHKYFSKNLFWFFAIVGVILGFWLG